MQNYVRKIRESKKLTLEQVANLLGVTKAQVSKMERGLIRLNDEWLDRLSLIYNCSVHDLIDDDKPKRILSNDDDSGSDFVTVKLLGDIDAGQGGFVVGSPIEDQYSLRFKTPKAVSGTKTKLLAYNLKGDFMNSHLNGCQMVFAELSDKNKHLIKYETIVLCSQKNKSGSDEGLFMRIIDKDEYGYPHAAYKIKYGRNSYIDMVSTILAGNIGNEGLFEIYRDMDNGKAKRRSSMREVHLQNNGIELKAILVKTIRDE